jgi:hypothetical protein
LASVTLTGCAVGDTPVNGVINNSGVARVEVSLPADSLLLGDSVTAVATGRANDGQAIGLPSIQWSSSDSTIAVVSTAGVVQARNTGSVTLTALAGGRTGSQTLRIALRPIRVQLIAPDSVRLTDDATARVTVETLTGISLGSVAPRVFARDTAIVSLAGAGNGIARILPRVPGSTELLALIGNDTVRRRITVRMAAYRGLLLQVTDRTLLSGDSIPVVIGAVDSTGRTVLAAGTTLSLEPAGGIRLRNGWLIGVSPGSTVLRATHGTLSARDTVIVQAPSPFPLQLVDGNEQSPLPFRIRNSMARVAERWRRVLREPPPTEQVNLPARACRNVVPVVRPIAGLLVLVTLDTLPPNVVARAGPCLRRASGAGLPIVGGVSLNIFMINGFSDDKLDDIIAHEVGHVFGIGVGWDEGAGGALVEGDTLSNDPIFTGVQARRAFALLGDSRNFSGRLVPLQLGVLGHWRSGALGGELMAPVVTLTRQPLSAVTAAALQDLGWTMDLNGYEDYAVPPAVLTQGGHVRADSPVVRVGGATVTDEVMSPLLRLRYDGSLVRLPPSGESRR